jgi:hypothetical protein
VFSEVSEHVSHIHIFFFSGFFFFDDSGLFRFGFGGSRRDDGGGGALGLGEGFTFIVRFGRDGQQVFEGVVDHIRNSGGNGEVGFEGNGNEFLDSSAERFADILRGDSSDLGGEHDTVVID